MTRAEEQLCAKEYARTKSPGPRGAPRRGEHEARCEDRVYLSPLAVRRVRSGPGGEPRPRSGGRAIRPEPRHQAPAQYAAWWIRAFILKYTLDNWRLVKFGTSDAQRKLFFSMRRQQRVLESHGIEANSRNLAGAMNVKEKDVVLMMERTAGAPRRRWTRRAGHWEVTSGPWQRCSVTGPRSGRIGRSRPPTSHGSSGTG